MATLKLMFAPRRNSPKRMALLEQSCAARKYEDAELLRDLASIYALRNDFESACECLKKRCEYEGADVQQDDIYAGLTEQITKRIDLLGAKKDAQSGDLLQQMKLQFDLLRANKSNEAIDLGNELVQENKTNAEVLLLQAIASDVMGRTEKALQNWKEAVRLLVNNPGVKFSRIQGTRNEMYEFENKKFLRDTFLFEKSSEQKGIEHKFNCTGYAYDSVRDKKKAGRALVLLQENGFFYAAYQRAPGNNIEKICGKKMLAREGVEKILVQLQEYQAMLTKNKGNAQKFGLVFDIPRYKAEFEKKFLDQISPVELSDTDRARLSLAYCSVSGFLEAQQRKVVHGDFHAANVIFGRDVLGRDNLCIIDPEGLCFALPEKDVGRFAARMPSIAEPGMIFDVWSELHRKEKELAAKKCYFSALHESLLLSGAARRRAGSDDWLFWKDCENYFIKNAAAFARINSSFSSGNTYNDFKAIEYYLAGLAVKS